MNRSIRAAVILFSLGLAALLGWRVSQTLSAPAHGAGADYSAVGGLLDLIDQDGAPRAAADFRGKLLLVYFGYAHCPDVCPTALSNIALALDILDEAAAEVTPIFVTVDPQRDTAPVLKAYLGGFGPGFVGLTGTPEQVAKVAKAWKVYYKLQPANAQGAYPVDHSSVVYLMDREGKYLAHFSHQATPEQIAEATAKALSPTQAVK